MVQQEDKGAMNTEFSCLAYRYKKSGGPDNDLISLAREFVARSENEGILPTTAMRKFFTNVLRFATGHVDEVDSSFIERYIKPQLRKIEG